MVECKVTTNLYITGLGPTIEVSNYFTEDEPAEALQHYTVVSAPMNLDSGSIAISTAHGLWLKAESGTIYVLFANTTTNVTATNAALALGEGESNYYSLNMSASDGVRVGGSAATAAVSYVFIGE